MPVQQFDFGKPLVAESWTTGYFIPMNSSFHRPPEKNSLYEDLSNKLISFKPDLIAVSCYSNQWKIVQEILFKIKKAFPEILNIVGGCHPSFVPEEVISDPAIDMICIGEGEEALLELCDRITRKIITWLTKYYWKKEPTFKDIDQLAFY